MAIVLAIGDTHCPGMREDYVPFLVNTAKKYKVTRVVHIGDLVDNHTISYHETNKKKRDGDKEGEKAELQIKQLTDAFPEVDLMLGNHDVLPDRKAQTFGIPDRFIRSFRDQWKLPKGWKIHERWDELIIDGVIYCHGDTSPCAGFAPLAKAKARGRSLVCGHYHSMGGFLPFAHREKMIFGMATGCGIEWKDPLFSYGANLTTKPIIGCGVVDGGQDFFFRAMPLKSKRV